MTLQYTARPALFSDGTTKAVVGDWVTIYVNGDPDHYDARIIAPITRVCGGYRYVLQYTGPVLEQADVLSVVVQTCCDAVASQAAADLAEAVDQAAEDLAAGLATKAPLTHTHVSADVTDSSSTPSTGKLAKWPSSGTFPPSAHSHSISGVVGLQTVLDGTITGEPNKLLKAGYNGQVQFRYEVNIGPVADVATVYAVCNDVFGGIAVFGETNGEGSQGVKGVSHHPDGMGLFGYCSNGTAFQPPLYAGVGVFGYAHSYYGGVFGSDDPTKAMCVHGSTFNVTTHRTISASNATGTKGDVCHDANYLYICTATDTWKRVPLTW